MSFKDIYGHEKQIKVLRIAIGRDRVAHAYLFYGAEGVGKRTVAEVFAKALNCASGRETKDACDQCPSCLKIDHGNHPDVVTVSAQGQFIKIEEIRELQDQMKFRPFEGGRRVFIIVDADRMNIASANALLKTLEEPSASNVLILITSRPHQLPATVLSRCQQLRFNPLTKENIASFLLEKSSLDSETAQLLALSSGGSIGNAAAITDESYLATRAAILDVIAKIKAKDHLGLLASVSDFGQERKDITERLGILMTGFRDALVYKETGNAANLINQDYIDLIKSVAGSYSGGCIINCMRAVDQASRTINQNANKQLTLEVMMFTLGKHCE
ncbi:MAG TPA: DNA polymerase III subunit delta' [Syntrophales bacterium]|nr:DNA polymerase III subunit delta' [Syntrophales bacterium]